MVYLKRVEEDERVLPDRACFQVGMDYRYVGAIERGEVNITADNIERITNGFGILAYQLFQFSAEEKKLDEEAVSEEQIREMLQTASPEVKAVLVQIMRLGVGWGGEDIFTNLR